MEDFYRQKEAGREVILAKGELFVGKVTFLLGRGPQSQECWPSNSRLTCQRSPPVAQKEFERSMTPSRAFLNCFGGYASGCKKS